MEDLAETEEILFEDFRFVSSDFRHPCGRAVQQGSLAFGFSLLTVSSRYGYAFAANKDSIAVYTLESTRSGEPCQAISTFTLDAVDRIFELRLLLEDRLLIAHATKEHDEELGELIALDALKLVEGSPCRHSVLDGVQCSSFATFDSKLPLISVITSNRRVRTLEIGPSSRELWSENGNSFESEAPIGLAFSANGKEIAVCTRRGSVQILDARSGARKGNVKEVESGWTPIDAFYVTPKASREKGLEELFVCYQNDLNVYHIIWKLDSGNVVSSSGLGQLFFPDDTVSSESKMRTYCEFIQDWDTLVLANSCSIEVRLVTYVDEVWNVWGLEEGKELEFPLSQDDEQIFPTGFGLDYTDVSKVIRDDNRPPANPMPRFVALTSLDELWSVGIVDDRDGIQCLSVRSAMPTSGVEPLRLEPVHEMKNSIDAPTEPKSVSTRTASEEELPTSGFADVQDSALNLSGFSNSLKAVEGYNDPFANPVSSSFKDHRNTATSPTDTASSSTKEAFGNANVGARGQWSSFSSLPFEGSGIGASSREIVQNTRDGNTSASVDMSQPLMLAKNKDPANQLLSIIEAMKREIEHVHNRKVDAEKAANSVAVEVEKKLRSIKDRLSSLMEMDTEYWEREKDARSLVGKQLKSVIEVGQCFEELNLLNALLSENDDTRPLPAEVQAEDKELNRKESAFLERLDEVERKIEGRDPQLTQAQRSGQQGSGPEVSLHIYSSLTLQGVRIKRVRAVLDSLNSQLRCAMEEDENNPASSNIPRSRLRRLSKHVPPTTPATNRSSRVHTSGGSERRLNAMSDGVRGLILSTSTAPRVENSVATGYRSAQSTSTAVRSEAVRTLRSLAMRKGREKIIAKEFEVAAPRPRTSNSSQGPPTSGATVTQSEIVGSSRPNIVSHSTSAHALEKVTETIHNGDDGFGLGANSNIFEATQNPPFSASSRSETSSHNDEDNLSVPTSSPPLPTRSPSAGKRSGLPPETQPLTFGTSLRFSQSTPAFGETSNTATAASGVSVPADSRDSDASFAKTFGQSSLFGNVSNSSTLNFASSSSLFGTSSFGATLGQSSYGLNKGAVKQEDESSSTQPPETAVEEKDEVQEDSTPETEDEQASDNAEEDVVTNDPSKYPETLPGTPSQTPTDTIDFIEAPSVPAQPSSIPIASLPEEPKIASPPESEKPASVASTVGLFGQARISDEDSKPASTAAPVSVFGASLLGEQSSMASLFGNGASTSQAFSGFGASAQTSQGSSSAFGQSGFGQTSTFGQSSASFGQASSFGQSSSSAFGQSSSSAFGQSSSAFGQSSSFGQSAFGQSSFGQAGLEQPSSFGLASNMSASALGSKPSASFGATSTFGIAASAPAFGAPSSFGANGNPAGFGSGLSGMQSAPLFGAATPTKSFDGFGGAGTPQGKQSPFGQVSSGSGGFGGFGTGGNAGSGGQSPFGAVSGNQGGIGGAVADSASGFGQAGGGTGFGGGSGFGSGGSGFGSSAGFGSSSGFAQSQSQQFKSDSFTRRRA